MGSANDISANKLQILQNDWWQTQFARFTPENILLVLLFSLIASLIIALIYKKTYRGVLYNPSFNVTLILLTMVTSSVVMAIGSNVALSMGMVGALSIVRFRTAVKDPIDTGYMFWSITMGILIGTGYYLPAIVVVVGISVVMIALSYFKLRPKGSYLLVIHYDTAYENYIISYLKPIQPKRMRSKTISRNGTEITYEIKTNSNESLISRLLEIDGVIDATLVSCESESAY